MSLKEALNIIKMEWQIMRYQLLRVKNRRSPGEDVGISVQRF